MNDVPDALVKRGVEAQEPWRTVLSTEDRGNIARAVLAAVLPDLAEERRRAIESALIFAAAHDDHDARPVVDRDALAEALHRGCVERWAAIKPGTHAGITKHGVEAHYGQADAILAAGIVQDAADVRRAVAEETLLATANFVEREAAAAWGGDAPWLTTGKHVAAVVAGLLRERAREAGDPR